MTKPNEIPELIRGINVRDFTKLCKQNAKLVKIVPVKYGTDVPLMQRVDGRIEIYVCCESPQMYRKETRLLQTADGYYYICKDDKTTLVNKAAIWQTILDNATMLGFPTYLIPYISMSEKQRLELHTQDNSLAAQLDGCYICYLESIQTAMIYDMYCFDSVYPSTKQMTINLNRIAKILEVPAFVDYFMDLVARGRFPILNNKGEAI